jgi:hypothetical protein
MGDWGCIENIVNQWQRPEPSFDSHSVDASEPPNDQLLTAVLCSLPCAYAAFHQGSVLTVKTCIPALSQSYLLREHVNSVGWVRYYRSDAIKGDCPSASQFAPMIYANIMLLLVTVGL